MQITLLSTNHKPESFRVNGAICMDFVASAQRPKPMTPLLGRYQNS